MPARIKVKSETFDCSIPADRTSVPKRLEGVIEIYLNSGYKYLGSLVLEYAVTAYFSYEEKT